MKRRMGGDETWHRLLNWTKGQKEAERLAAQLARVDGYETGDPSHPMGGRDGKKDAICTKAGESYVIAVYFPRGQQRFKDIKKKFLHDSKGLNEAKGIIFVTNQELRLAERRELRDAIENKIVDIFHLERVAQLLDLPRCYGLRFEFLDIEMSKEEQLSFFEWVQSQNTQEMLKNIQNLSDISTGGNSFCYIEFTPSIDSNRGRMVLIHKGEFPLYNVTVRIVNLDEFETLIKNSPSLEKIQANDTYITVNEVPPNHVMLTDEVWRFEDLKPKRYNIFFVARNGSFTQLLRLVYHGNQWIKAIQVQKDEKILFEQVHEEYPRNALGDVEW